MKPIRSLKPDYSGTMASDEDIKHICDCGSLVGNLKVSFDDYEIATYFLDMECSSCGSYALAPTPLDRPLGESN